MNNRNSTESELEEDVTKIDFPRPISPDEADRLLRYFTAQLYEPEGSYVSIETTLARHRRYGDMLAVLGDEKFETVADVRVKDCSFKLAGSISLGNSCKVESASFEFRQGFNQLDESVFYGVDFSVTPGYSAGELNTDSTDIMKNMRKYAESYFARADKKH